MLVSSWMGNTKVVISKTKVLLGRISLLVFLALFGCTVANVDDAAASDKGFDYHQLNDESRRILVIFSHHAGQPSAVNLFRGMQAVFRGDRDELYVEYMDADRISSAAYKAKFLALLQYKLTRIGPIDLVITVADEAIDFTISHRELLFPGVPIIFSAVMDDRRIEVLGSQPLVVGVISTVTIPETLKLVLSLQPQVKKIQVIVDDSAQTERLMAPFHEARKLFPKLEFGEISLARLSWREFYDEIGQLTADNALLLISATKDKDGKRLSFPAFLTGIRENAAVPVYHLWEEGVGTGLLGGHLIRGYELGQQVARVAQTILVGGHPVSEIPSMRGNNVWLVDYEMLKKYSLAPGGLPAKTIIINQPTDFFSDNAIVLCVSLVVFAIFSVFIFWMQLLLWRRKKKMKALLRTQEAAVNASNSKSAFIANMSHELRTPLSAIIGFSDLLAQDFAGPLNERQQHYIKRVRVASKRLLTLINDLLNIARIEAGREEVFITQNRLQTVISEVVAIIDVEARAKNIQIETAFENVTDLAFDRNKISQVLLNLLSNAVKFSAVNSKVGVHAVADEKFLKITVWDNGIGIKKEHQEYIFGDFNRVEFTYTRILQGAGLGLAISRKLIELHGGWIWVESEAESGARFHFKIPRVYQLTPAVKIQETQPWQTKTERCLSLKVVIIEDDEPTRELLETLLNSAGFLVKTAINGRQGVELIKSFNPNIALFDIGLPEINGIDALAELVRLGGDKGCTMIATTAFVTAKDKQRFIDIGFDGIIPKPIDVKSFVGEIINIHGSLKSS